MRLHHHLTSIHGPALPPSPPTGHSHGVLDQYLTQLLHSTTSRCHLPPLQGGQHHVFSAEHTTRDILSLMAQVQGLTMPSESVYRDWDLLVISSGICIIGDHR